ncbi:MAG: hypothetical protein Q8N88_04705 [Nanoarchaeota archaeon]|nr:hypothetical protein [Nanoarchaeota archaeon]
MINKRIKFMGIFLVVVLVLSLGLISAFGTSCDYSITNPLKMSPGESSIITVKAKSSPTEGNLTIKAQMVNDAGIAELVDSNKQYFISPGLAGDGIVNIRISIPEDAVLGEEYEIEVNLLDISGLDGVGTIGITTSISNKIKVIVAEKIIPSAPETPKETGINLIWWIIAIIVIIAIILLLIKKKK